MDLWACGKTSREMDNCLGRKVDGRVKDKRVDTWGLGG